MHNYPRTGITEQRVNPDRFSKENTSHSTLKEYGARKLSGVVGDTFQHEFTSVDFIVTDEPQTITSANKRRRYLLIQNKGSAAVFIAFGNTPSFAAGVGIRLNGGDVLAYENGVVPNNEIRAVCGPTSKVTVCEGILVT